MKRNRWGRLFALDAVVHLVALSYDLPQGPGDLVRVTQVLLMPLLLLAFLRQTKGRQTPHRGWVASALFFCFLGDALPGWVPESDRFLAMVGPFAVAQLCFVVALWSARRRVRLPAKAFYTLVWVVLLAICLPRVDDLLVPVVAYGVLLATVGALSTGRSLVAGLGGALFLFSDSLIAIGTFAPELASGTTAAVIIMATYIGACWLLAKSFTVTTRVDLAR